MDGKDDAVLEERVDPDATLRDAMAAERAESQRLMISGLAIGALDVVAIAALGVSCPLCAVGAPALIGWGAYRRWKVHQLAKEMEATRETDAPSEPIPPEPA